MGFSFDGFVVGEGGGGGVGWGLDGVRWGLMGFEVGRGD